MAIETVHLGGNDAYPGDIALDPIAGSENAVRYMKLHRYVLKVAFNFWHDPDEDETSGLISRLGILQYATKQIPDLDESVRNQAFIPAADLIFLAHDNAIQRATDYRAGRDKKGKYPRLNNTYQEVYAMPQIRQKARRELIRESEPTTEVITSFENWLRTQNPDLRPSMKQLGDSALESYAFSVGATIYLPALGRAASAHLNSSN